MNYSKPRASLPNPYKQELRKPSEPWWSPNSIEASYPSLSRLQYQQVRLPLRKSLLKNSRSVSRLANVLVLNTRSPTTAINPWDKILTSRKHAHYLSLLCMACCEHGGIEAVQRMKHHDHCDYVAAVNHVIPDGQFLFVKVISGADPQVRSWFLRRGRVCGIPKKGSLSRGLDLASDFPVGRGWTADAGKEPIYDVPMNMVFFSENAVQAKLDSVNPPVKQERLGDTAPDPPARGTTKVSQEEVQNDASRSKDDYRHTQVHDSHIERITRMTRIWSTHNLRRNSRFDRRYTSFFASPLCVFDATRLHGSLLLSPELSFYTFAGLTSCCFDWECVCLLWLFDRILWYRSPLLLTTLCSALQVYCHVNMPPPPPQQCTVFSMMSPTRSATLLYVNCKSCKTLEFSYVLSVNSYVPWNKSWLLLLCSKGMHMSPLCCPLNIFRSYLVLNLNQMPRKTTFAPVSDGTSEASSISKLPLAPPEDGSTVYDSLHGILQTTAVGHVCGHCMRAHELTSLGCIDGIVSRHTASDTSFIVPSGRKSYCCPSPSFPTPARFLVSEAHGGLGTIPYGCYWCDTYVVWLGLEYTYIQVCVYMFGAGGLRRATNVCALRHHQY